MTLILHWVCEIFFSVISKNHLSVKTVLSSLREHVGEFEMKSQISPQFVIFTHSHLQTTQTSVFLNPAAAVMLIPTLAELLLSRLTASA